MAATDEDLQKLGKPPIYSGKEDEWSEWSFGVSVIGARSSAAGRCDSSQETLPRLSDERERTSTGCDQRNDRHEWSIGMAGVDLEIHTEHSAESTKSHERNPQCEDLSLRAHSLRSPWSNGKRTFASGNRFLETVSTRQ